MYYICVDIGGTSIKYGVLNKNGEIFINGTLPTRVNENENFILSDIKKLVRKILKQYPNYIIKGIAISSAGVIDPNKGEVIFSGPTIPKYQGTKIKEELEKEFSIPCEVENDVNCAALGEYWQGAGKDSKSMVCLTVGTGIGGAIILNGNLLNGVGYTAGEIGYMEITDNNKYIQDIASTRYLVDLVIQEKKKVNKFNENINGLIVFELAKQGDEICISAIDTMLNNLAKTIRNIVYLLNPEVVVIGGGITEQKEYLQERLENKVYEKLVGDIFKKTKIKLASQANQAGFLGALYNFLKKHNEI